MKSAEVCQSLSKSEMLTIAISYAMPFIAFFLKWGSRTRVLDFSFFVAKHKR